MAFTASFDRPAAPLGFRKWVSRKIEAHKIESEKGRTYRRIHGELSRLSDRDLADIGISRLEIESIATEHAYG